MVSIPSVIADIIKQTPFLEQGISLRIINLSSLARIIKPQIKKKFLDQINSENKNDIQIGAIVMALKRIEIKLKKHSISNLYQIPVFNCSVRTNLVEFTFANSPTLMVKQKQILDSTHKDRDSFLTFTRGVYETTLIISASQEKEAEQTFAEEALICKLTNLCSITIILPKKSVKQPGVYYQILKKLAWDNINIIEVISSMTELTIILNKFDIDRAFSILKA